NGRKVDYNVLAVNGSGDDFNVYEERSGIAEFDKMRVEVSTDGITWYLVPPSTGPPTLIPSDSFSTSDAAFVHSYDLANARDSSGNSAPQSAIRYIRIVGTDASSGGFDLDAIGIIHPGTGAPIFPSVLWNTTGADLGNVTGPPDNSSIAL